MAVVCLTVLAFQPSKLRGRQPTSLAKASSVPGRTQTAVLASSGAANPLVPVLTWWVVSLSPTLAGRDLTLCKLYSHVLKTSSVVASPSRHKSKHGAGRPGPLTALRSRHGRVVK